MATDEIIEGSLNSETTSPFDSRHLSRRVNDLECRDGSIASFWPCEGHFRSTPDKQTFSVSIGMSHQDGIFLLIFNPVSMLTRERESPMTQEHPMMVGAATVFVVSNITKSIEHYRDALGFTVTFQYGNPTFYACLCRDEVALHLLAAHETKRLPGNGGICVFVKDVDLVHVDLVSRGANVIKAPQNYDYGMRDFDVVDLDGNHLTFGMESLSTS